MTTIPFQALLILPFLILGIVVGWRRGLAEELITTVVLALALGLFNNPDRALLFGSLINSIVRAFASFFSALLGTDLNPPDLVRTDNVFVQFLLYILIVFIAYLAGSAFGKRQGISRGKRLGGALFGALNVFLVGAQAVNFINRYRPSVLDRQIIVQPDSGTNSLQNYLPTLLTIVVLIGIIVFFLNLRERRR
jgi:CDP-diglyceride synthetase